MAQKTNLVQHDSMQSAIAAAMVAMLDVDAPQS
jgi:hypothetical protein